MSLFSRPSQDGGERRRKVWQLWIFNRIPTSAYKPKRFLEALQSLQVIDLFLLIAYFCGFGFVQFLQCFLRSASVSVWPDIWMDWSPRCVIVYPAGGCVRNQSHTTSTSGNLPCWLKNCKAIALTGAHQITLVRSSVKKSSNLRFSFCTIEVFNTSLDFIGNHFLVQQWRGR